MDEEEIFHKKLDRHQIAPDVKFANNPIHIDKIVMNVGEPVLLKKEVKKENVVVIKSSKKKNGTTRSVFGNKK